jgi:hypothetical protein
MSDDPAMRKARAAARESWPVRALRLGEEEHDDLSHLTTVAERLSSRTIPDYSRAELRSTVFRRGDPRPDDDDQPR